jgi:DNA invertase Pin-like site-specific DNA recombinase
MLLAVQQCEEEGMPETELNELVSAYRSSGEGRDHIMEKVAALVYDAHRRYGFDDEDDAANALLKFRGRIARLVDRFEDRGVPFDAYLATSLRFLARTARRERRRILERESVCDRAVFSETAEPNAEWPEGEPAGEREARPGLDGRGRTAARRRPRARGGVIPRCPAEAAAYSSRLVFLAVKCAWEIDEAGISAVADSAGVDREWLAAAVEQARRSLVSERSRLELLMERRNGSWTRLRLLELRLAEEADPHKKARLESAKGREEQRLANAREELGVLRTIVPNSVVARILGIPKGTVDSGLYYLRKRYGPAQD